MKLKIFKASIRLLIDNYTQARTQNFVWGGSLKHISIRYFRNFYPKFLSLILFRAASARKRMDNV